ncbi:MAG: cyclodeaminase/cyclohydrolase family protein [Acidobacteria bacterium]|nr:cyclodeaminase/cyclohydrolase family protein [Acidobacteriota bacterium]
MQEIDGFLSALAAAKPLPGGGSAAALAGALAAALGEMMAGLTEGRDNFESIRSQVLEIHAEMAGCRNELKSLVEEDALAYQSLLDAIRMPRGTGEQMVARKDAMEKAVRSATDTPLRTARVAVRILEGLKTLIEIGIPSAKSDAAVGVQLAYACLKGGQYNVLANIRRMADTSFAGRCRTEITDLVQKGHEILRQIDRQITAR